VTTARLLTPPTNYAVVQLPERAFPGVVFQGDSLNILIGELEAAIEESDPGEQEAAFEEILGRLRAVRTRYENTLNQAGMRLPY
jgi:predicted RNase H-like HicB family nuclease